MKKGLIIGLKLASLILAFVTYSMLQSLYFYPKSYHIIAASEGWLALVTLVGLALIYWLYRWSLRGDNAWRFNLAPHWDWRRLLIALGGFILIVFASATMLGLLGYGNSANQQALDTIERHGQKRLFAIMVVLIAPICEELIFRGLLFNLSFARPSRWHTGFNLVLSGLVFGYLHDPTFSPYLWVYVVLGIILAGVYLKTRDVRYSILVHVAYNALGFI